MRGGGKVYQQMPHQMVMTKSLLGVEYRANGVEHTAKGYVSDKLPRGVTQKQREEEYNGPAHHEIYRKADGRYGASAERLIEDAEDNHRPLQDEDEPALPATDDGERYGGGAARDGYIYKYVVEDMEYLLVACVVHHRVVERRDEEHQKDRYAEDAHTYAGEYAAAMQKTPHRRKGQSKEHQDTHHAVRDGVAYLLAKCGNVYLCHKFCYKINYSKII